MLIGTIRRMCNFIFPVISAIAVVIILAFSGCGKAEGEAGQEKPEAWISDEPMEVSMLYADDDFAPFDSKWPLLDEIKKRTNVTLKLQTVPGMDYAEKLQLLVNTGDMPDIITRQWPSAYSDFCLKGSFLPVSDYMNQLPNFKAIIDKWDLHAEYESNILTDGKFYWLPGLMEKPAYSAGLIIRSDLASKYARDIRTFDELYLFLKWYKASNPESYPLGGTYGFDCLLSFIGNCWGVQGGWSSPTGLYYDYDEKRYVFTMTSEKYRAMLSYLSRLMKEGLMDPEITTVDDATYKERLASGRSIATWFYNEPFAGINNRGRKLVSQDFELCLVEPIAGPAGAYTNNTDSKFVGGWMLPSRVTERADFDRLLKFVDWMAYSEEGYTLTSWGIENLTYVITDGRKVFTGAVKNSGEGISRTLQAKFGLNMGSFSVTRTSDFLMALLDENVKPVAQAVTDKKMDLPIIPKVQLSEGEQEQSELLQSALNSYCSDMQHQFIYGKKSLETDWEEFVNEVDRKGRKALEDIYNNALEKSQK